MASTYRQRRGLQGVSKLRRKLRRIIKQADNSIRPAIEQTAYAIELDAQNFAPKLSGELALSIETKISGDGLGAVIGPGAKSAAVAREARGTAFATRSTVKLGNVSKKKLFNFFKGYWQEFGTKGTPGKNIPPQPAQPFMTPAFDVNKDYGKRLIGKEVQDLLRRVARE
jgi:HK97 gp10 family phage protein